MRMQHSAQIVSIPPVPESHFLACVNILIASQTQFVPPHNSNTLLYIRPILFGSSAQLALTSPTEFTFAIFIQPGSAYHGVTGQDALVSENFDRTATHGTGNAKVGGNYAPVMKYTVAAQKEGFGLLLHLDSKTMSEIDEFSTSGFVGVKNDGGEREGKHTLVIPNSKTVIKSVTTDTIAELATSWGWSVERRAVGSLEFLRLLFTVCRFCFSSTNIWTCR
jgi:branched-chain amino acid aminotransferase